MSILILRSIIIYLLLITYVNANDHCGNNEQARLLAQLIIKDGKQNRSTIRCNKLLTEVALSKAKKMLEFGLIAHTLDGSPNDRLRAANYQLPKYYGNDFNSNQVEAIAGGYKDAEEVWSAFKRSEAHRTHLLAEHEFYLEQDEIGVALIKEWNSPHVEYWVIYLAKGLQQDQSKTKHLDDIPNKSLFIMQAPKE
ncbi:CAP domain-containing protein [Colwellia demingiae]|uniref:CAP domain-containing protein n=1 Tax=Colwellia demingiae TaxID=89401 RepID=UPI001FE72DF6|nr:CAP domain-containing protein [Colwellia demingiae]